MRSRKAKHRKWHRWDTKRVFVNSRSDIALLLAMPGGEMNLSVRVKCSSCNWISSRKATGNVHGECPDCGSAVIARPQHPILNEMEGQANALRMGNWPGYQLQYKNALALDMMKIVKRGYGAIIHGALGVWDER